MHTHLPCAFDVILVIKYYEKNRPDKCMSVAHKTIRIACTSVVILAVPTNVYITTVVMVLRNPNNNYI